MVFFAGLLGALFSFLQYLSSPILGALSDVYGRKQLLILTMVRLTESKKHTTCILMYSYLLQIVSTDWYILIICGLGHII